MTATRQQRRAAARYKAPVSPVPPTPYLRKLQRKLPKASLAELVSLLKRFSKARNALGYELKRWRRDTQGRLMDDQWPDKGRMIRVALCYSAVVDHLAERGTKLSS